MLYCEKCVDAEKLWDVSMGVQLGNCSKCGHTGMCHDIPRDPEAFRKVMKPREPNNG